MIEIGRSKNDQYLLSVPETTMIAILEGINGQIERYEVDLVDPRFSDTESAEFIQSMLGELNELKSQAAPLIVVTENGWVRSR
jgi:hypothetical protein